MTKTKLRINRAEKFFVIGLSVGLVWLALYLFVNTGCWWLALGLLVLVVSLCYYFWRLSLSRLWFSPDDDFLHIEIYYIGGKRNLKIKFSDIKAVEIATAGVKSDIFLLKTFIFGVPGTDFTKKGIRIIFNEPLFINIPLLYNPSYILSNYRYFEDALLYCRSYGLVYEALKKRIDK